jgi:uncharacterized protein (TIGR03437 family)
MRPALCVLILFLVLTATAVAQNPAVSAAGILNSASYAYVGLPNSAIAQGSIFVIFGTNMGPSTLQQISSFPLPTNLGGTSIKVTVGGTTVNCIMIYTSANQVAALLPSNTPVGSGTLTVTYNGNASSSAAIQVIDSSFGIYTLNQQGSGPGIITDANYQVYSLSHTAKAGDVSIIWGTGVGPVQGDEAGGPLPGNLASIPVEVYVGTQKAQITYAGRSGCCSGLDQIGFVVPQGVTGCHVPVAVKIKNNVSNFVTTSIGNGGTCSDPTGPTSTDITNFLTKGGSFGSVNLNRSTTTSPALPPPIGTGQATTTTSDSGSATFYKYTAQQLNLAQNPFSTYTIGTCVVFTYSGQSAAASDPIKPVGLDAGAQITVNGPNGTKQLTPSSVLGKGFYSAALGGGTPPSASPLYLDAGSYPITGPGGADVGTFSLNLTVPPSLTWTNMASVDNVVRANGQLVTWTGGDPNGTVTISGTSIKMGTNANGSDSVGAFFSCTAPDSDLQFTIPIPVLLSLPVTSVIAPIPGVSIPEGTLSISSATPPVKFTATGLDFSFGSTSVSVSKSVAYQ